MNLLSILGKLPASDSPAGTLNKLDYEKILRMALVTFVGAYAAVVAQTDLADAASSWEQVRDVLLIAPGKAALTAVGAAAVEWVRRRFS